MESASLPAMLARALRTISVVCGVIFAVVLTVMSTGPEQAETNLCRLVRNVVANTPDACLHGLPPIAVQSALGIGLALAIIYTFWPLLRRLWPSKLERLDNMIEFEWRLFTGEVRNPPDEHYLSVALVPLPVENMKGGGWTSALAQGTAAAFRHVWRCRVINRSGVPIFNAEFDLWCVFREVVRNAQSSAIVTAGPPEAGVPGSVTGTGAELLRRPWRVKAIRIEADPDRPFVFFLENPNEVWVVVGAPDSIEFQRLGAHKREAARLLPPPSTHIWLHPPPIDMQPAPPATTSKA